MVVYLSDKNVGNYKNKVVVYRRDNKIMQFLLV